MYFRFKSALVEQRNNIRIFFKVSFIIWGTLLIAHLLFTFRVTPYVSHVFNFAPFSVFGVIVLGLGVCRQARRAVWRTLGALAIKAYDPDYYAAHLELYKPDITTAEMIIYPIDDTAMPKKIIYLHKRANLFLKITQNWIVNVSLFFFLLYIAAQYELGIQWLYDAGLL